MNEDKILGFAGLPQGLPHMYPSPAGIMSDDDIGQMAQQACAMQSQAGMSPSDAMSFVGVMMMAAFAGGISSMLTPVRGLYDIMPAAEQRIAETELRANAYMACIDPRNPGDVISVRALARDEVMAELAGETLVFDEDY